MYNSVLPPFSTENDNPVATDDPLVVVVGKLQAQITALELRLSQLENPPAG